MFYPVCLFMCFVFLSILVFFSLSGGFGWLLSFGFWSYAWGDYFFVFSFDSLSVCFSLMLLCCGVAAIFYVYHYFSDPSDSTMLSFMIHLFLGVMSFLVFCDSLVLVLVMWDYLGLVSFFLILFYSNMSSMRASFVTLCVSRLGDVAIFFVMMFSYYFWWDSLFFLTWSLLFIVLTKSACYPFISWLVEAMRAPTPVSSVVHSATLVTAGVWFLLRFEDSFNFSGLSYLVVFCVLTILVTGFSACILSDMKKIVALSTCSNISWCILFFILGDFNLCLLQLLTHGLCKCYLFMSIGDIMSCSGGSQSSNLFYFSRYGFWCGLIARSLLVMSLCGVPFLGVFLVSMGFLVVCWVFVMLSFCYCCCWGLGLHEFIVFGFAFS